MSRLSRTTLIAVVLVLAVIAVPAVLYATHSWGGYHWARQQNPFTVKLGDNVSAAWQTSLENASADWSVSNVLDTTIVAGRTKPKSCRPTAGQDEICSASYGNTGWLGIAQIWITGGTHITQGIVKVNDYYFNMPQYNTPSWRALVMCQEIGHTFGLDHQDENFNNPNLGTCMDYTSNPDGPPANTSPNQHDYDELSLIYAHLDSFTTVSQAAPLPAAMGVFDGNEPSHWGRLVRGSREKGFSTYVLDFGHGNQIVTHVTWAK